MKLRESEALTVRTEAKAHEPLHNTASSALSSGQSSEVQVRGAVHETSSAGGFASKRNNRCIPPSLPFSLSFLMMPLYFSIYSETF